MQENQDIRDAVAALCQGFPGEYWRKKDRERLYPTEFVDALTEAGFLACLIPEEYGGSGLGITEAAAILEEVHRNGCNGGACHAQMYTMGTLLRHGSDAQKQQYLPKIASGKLRLQAFGVTEPTSGTDTSRISTTAKRDPSENTPARRQRGPRRFITISITINIIISVYDLIFIYIIFILRIFINIFIIKKNIIHLITY